MNPPREVVVSAELAGERLDRALAALLPEFSRSYLQKLIKDGKVSTPRGTLFEEQRMAVQEGQRLLLDIPIASTGIISAEPFAFPILFEDEHMLVIDKPAGVVVHPGAGNWTGTVVNALLSRYPGIQEWAEEATDRPGIVHRLDKDTSGCLAIARTAGAHFQLSTAFAERKVKKTYLALAWGHPKLAQGRLESSIGRHPVNRQKMAEVDRGGKLAVTLYKVLRTGWLERFPVSLIELDLQTGRTHQIRVHLSGMGHPVLGDSLYGNGRGPLLGRQLLHAWRLALPHPASGEILKMESPIPADMQTTLERLSEN